MPRPPTTHFAETRAMLPPRVRTVFVQVLAALALGATAGAAVAAGSVAVAQRNRAFDQRAVMLSRGDTLRFANEDEFVHQIYVEAPTMKFESAEQEPGKALDLRFPASGKFEVRCRIHPRMLLSVDVR